MTKSSKELRPGAISPDAIDTSAEEAEAIAYRVRTGHNGVTVKDGRVIVRSGR